jgi:hypothetical protein
VNAAARSSARCSAKKAYTAARLDGPKSWPSSAQCAFWTRSVAPKSEYTRRRYGSSRAGVCAVQSPPHETRSCGRGAASAARSALDVSCRGPLRMSMPVSHVHPPWNVADTITTGALTRTRSSSAASTNVWVPPPDEPVMPMRAASTPSTARRKSSARTEFHVCRRNVSGAGKKSGCTSPTQRLSVEVCQSPSFQPASRASPHATMSYANTTAPMRASVALRSCDSSAKRPYPWDEPQVRCPWAESTPAYGPAEPEGAVEVPRHELPGCDLEGDVLDAVSVELAPCSDDRRERRPRRCEVQVERRQHLAPHGRRVCAPRVERRRHTCEPREVPGPPRALLAAGAPHHLRARRRATPRAARRPGPSALGSVPRAWHRRAPRRGSRTPHRRSRSRRPRPAPRARTHPPRAGRPPLAPTPSRRPAPRPGTPCGWEAARAGHRPGRGRPRALAAP